MLHCCYPASGENIVPHIASSGQDQNSNFEVTFLLNMYRFCTIIIWGPLTDHLAPVEGVPQPCENAFKRKATLTTFFLRVWSRGIIFVYTLQSFLKTFFLFNFSRSSTQPRSCSSLFSLSLSEMLLMPAIPDLVSYLFPLFLIRLSSGSRN